MRPAQSGTAAKHNGSIKFPSSTRGADRIPQHFIRIEESKNPRGTVKLIRELIADLRIEIRIVDSRANNQTEDNL